MPEHTVSGHVSLNCSLVQLLGHNLGAHTREGNLSVQRKLPVGVVMSVLLTSPKNTSLPVRKAPWAESHSCARQR